MYMVSMMTYFFSVRGFGHPVLLKAHFWHPVMKILAKILGGGGGGGGGQAGISVQEFLVACIPGHI